MKVALVTGGAKRVGAQIVKSLWQQQFHVIIHYHKSDTEAEQLCQELNAQRPDSAAILGADLGSIAEVELLAKQAQNIWGQVDVLVNNASSFFPTPIAQITTETMWDDLMSSNCKGPFFLIQALAPILKQQKGSIINIVDIHAIRPMKNFTVYCAAKAGLFSLTKAFANELAPEVRVNGIAPGAILWPEDYALERKQRILSQIPLARAGEPQDIANAVVFLTTESYISGQILAIDGGRSINYMDLN